MEGLQEKFTWAGFWRVSMCLSDQEDGGGIPGRERDSMDYSVN